MAILSTSECVLSLMKTCNTKGRWENECNLIASGKESLKVQSSARFRETLHLIFLHYTPVNYKIYILLLIYKTRSHLWVSVLWVVFPLQQQERMTPGTQSQELSISEREHYLLPWHLSFHLKGYNRPSNYFHVHTSTPKKFQVSPSMASFCICVLSSPKSKPYSHASCQSSIEVYFSSRLNSIQDLIRQTPADKVDCWVLGAHNAQQKLLNSFQNQKNILHRHRPQVRTGEGPRSFQVESGFQTPPFNPGWAELPLEHVFRLIELCGLSS